MYRLTTPAHQFTLPINTSECQDILVTYAQGGTIVAEKHMDNGVLPEGMTLEGKKVIISLTQAETKAFSAKKATAQVRVLTLGGQAYASQYFDIEVKEVLNKDILT